MRMRKKAYQEEILSTRMDLIIEEPENHIGNWRNILNFDELRIEIGCGKGDYFRGMAKLYSNIGWIAIEKNKNIASIAIKNTPENVIANAKFIVKDAIDITQWFDKSEINVIHLNFSDPWPKKAHGKRRLTHDNFLTSYHRILADDGLIIMKTDNFELFNYSIESFDNCDLFEELEKDFNYREKEHNEDVITEYERRFMELGQPIYRGIWRKI